MVILKRKIRLKELNVVTFTLPLISVATFRQKCFTALDEILEDPLRREFIKKATVKAFQNVEENIGILASGTKTIFERITINILGVLLLKMFRDRIENYHGNIELKKYII